MGKQLTKTKTGDFNRKKIDKTKTRQGTKGNHNKNQRKPTDLTCHEANNSKTEFKIKQEIERT